MKTYDEKTGLEVESPDLEAGYVYPGRKKNRHRCLQDNCVWDAAGLPSAWEEVQQ